MDSKLEKRCDELFALKMKFNGEGYIGFEDYNKDFNVHITEMTCDSEEQWNKKILDLKTELEIRKNKI